MGYFWDIYGACNLFAISLISHISYVGDFHCRAINLALHRRASVTNSSIGGLGLGCPPRGQRSARYRKFVAPLFVVRLSEKITSYSEDR